jgi:hypothetical protein
MKKPPQSSKISIEFDGKNYSATYSVASKVVTVHSFYGSRATQGGGSGATAVARMLLREILQGAKERGELTT